MNSGSTAGPSAAAACICGDHAIGGNDVYVMHEQAGDAYCGRILAGLPINDHKFAPMRHADFVQVEEEGMSVADLEARKKDLCDDAMKVVESIFGEETLDRLASMHPFLKIVEVAYHLNHQSKIAEKYPRILVDIGAVFCKLDAEATQMGILSPEK